MRYIALILLFLTTAFGDSNVEEGRALYLEAKCQKCHLKDSKFDPNSIKKEGLKSKVKDKRGIHKWVVDCDNYFSIGWFPEEQDKVTDYLNSVYYKFNLSKESISK